MDRPELLWYPTPAWKSNSNLQSFLDYLQHKQGLAFDSYHALWTWSIEHIPEFWESIWHYFNVIDHGGYIEVLNKDQMPGAKWFSGAKINYAEHIFRGIADQETAILHQAEGKKMEAISVDQLKRSVSKIQACLTSAGVGRGDRIAAYLPNIPEATISFLSCCGIGAVWSSTSPDFGAKSVIDRFKQIKPKVLIACDGYTYGGKRFLKNEAIQDILKAVPSIQTLIIVPFLDEPPTSFQNVKTIYWAEVMDRPENEITFVPVPFDHPIWILYSSGTTGLPKAITHSHGGVLLEHFKYLSFHNDVHPGERFFWYSTTGWMMWNFVQASMLVGATIVLYEGSPAYPNLNVLWELAETAGIHHFGTSAPFIIACMKAGLNPGTDNHLAKLRSLGSTGAPLPPEAFAYVYDRIKEDIWLCSMSGGTDVCTAFVGGCPTRPVYRGEIQCRTLGCALYAFDPHGNPLQNKVGEMVITKPMPSMPIYFWNDSNGERYHSSYFDHFPGIWRHGDWVKITERDSLIIYGRSDATLNRQGIRIGTSEIYRVMDQLPEITDSIIVNLELDGGQHYMPLFIVIRQGTNLDNALKDKIKNLLRSTYSPRHVPDEIISIPEIPYTISGKKMEAPVKRILQGHPLDKVIKLDSMRNPAAIQFFLEFRKANAALWSSGPN